jgi:predicted dehydrogenase
VESLAKKYSVSNYSVSWQNVDPDLEAAIVALPHSLHCDATQTLLRRKVHVLCEKPLALNLREAKEMIDTAKENNVHLQVGNIRRLYWSSRKLKEIIESKIFGELKSISIQEGSAYNWPTTSGFFFDKKIAGGGVLIDTGAHALDLLIWLVDQEPVSFEYEDDNFGGVEAESQMKLHFKEGLSGCVKLSRLSKLSNNYIFIFENATVVFDPFDFNSLEVRKNGKSRYLASRKKRLFQQYFSEMLRDFHRTVKMNTSSLLAAANVLPSINLIEKCYCNRRPLHLPWLPGTESLKGAKD